MSGPEAPAVDRYPPRLDYLRVLAQEIDDRGLEPFVVVALGAMIDEWNTTHPSDANFFNSAMGSNLPLAIGLALARPSRLVLLLDTDGSLLMTLGALCTLASVHPPNLRVMVLDNESYAYTGGQPTATAGEADIAAIARGCGVAQASSVVTTDEFRERVAHFLDDEGLGFVVVKASSPPGVSLPRGFTRLESKYRFVRYVERSEQLSILPNR
jgi:thiamine pyrophosphate-dependent acetolactate synthase large subunit-like protein